MPRTSLPVLQSGGAFDSDGSDLTFTAADVVNGNQFAPTGREIVIARNTGGSGYLVTLVSVADPVTGRVGNVTKTVAAGAFAFFEVNNLQGWQQADGNVYLDAANAAVTFAVIRRA